MKYFFNYKKVNVALLKSVVLACLLYWVILLLRLPYQLTRFFQGYSFGLFVFVLIIYYLTYRLPGYFNVFAGLSFTLLLLAITLMYKWMSGYSDNFLIGGLLPYKDAKNFFVGANLILNGIPLEKAGQATERPLFPSFFSSVLLLSGQNLKISIAILVKLTGLGLYCSSRRVFHSFGAMSASLYSALLFFYIQPWAGYTMSELFGFTVGCIAFSVLWFASRNHKWPDLAIGFVVLLIAVSARAGAFLIFPLLAFWVGWIFRGEKRFSIKASIYTALIIGITYFAVNILYARLVGITEGASFGNFAYALYGQVRGGTGWHSAIEDLGTRDPAIVYNAAFDFFRRHPFSLLIAFVKSYRDFFLPGYPTIFPFDVFGQPIWLTYIIWSITMVALFVGLFRLIKNIRQNLASFLVAGFVGMFLSIPFLPPVDGGSRFYASTVPFFFVIPAIGISKLTNREQDPSNKELSNPLLRYSSGALIFLTLIMPILTYSLSKKTLPGAFSCPSAQNAYVIQINPDSYINFIQDGNTNCSIVPEVCLIDFKKNNSEFIVDDFYQEIYSMMKTIGMNARLIPAINLLDGEFHYFFVDSTKFIEGSSKNIVSGCATEVRTKNQSIYVVESFSPKR